MIKISYALSTHTHTDCFAHGYWSVSDRDGVGGYPSVYYCDQGNLTIQNCPQYIIPKTHIVQLLTSYTTSICKLETHNSTPLSLLHHQLASPVLQYNVHELQYNKSTGYRPSLALILFVTWSTTIVYDHVTLDPLSRDLLIWGRCLSFAHSSNHSGVAAAVLLQAAVVCVSLASSKPWRHQAEKRDLQWTGEKIWLGYRRAEMRSLLATNTSSRGQSSVAASWSRPSSCNSSVATQTNWRPGWRRSYRLPQMRRTRTGGTYRWGSIPANQPSLGANFFFFTTGFRPPKKKTTKNERRRDLFTRLRRKKKKKERRLDWLWCS